MDDLGGESENCGAVMTYYGGRDAHLEGETEMADRMPTDRLVELADRAERLAQDLAELRRRIDARPKRRPSSGNNPAYVPPPADSSPEQQESPATVRMPTRRDTPSSSETLMWLPAVKPPPARASTEGPPPRLRSEPANLDSPSSRSPVSGVRRIDPEAGRYSIIAAGRGKRRANG